MKPGPALAVVVLLIASAAPAKERLALDLPAGPLGVSAGERHTLSTELSGMSAA